MSTLIKIEDKIIGREAKPFIIAEIAQAHDGSLGIAHAYIDAVAETGADAIKFQTHIASEESTQNEPFRIKFSYQDKTRYDYWKRMEFTFEQWAGLAEHAREKGLIFLSSPFSRAAVELLKGLKIPAWKIGSGEINSLDMMEEMLKTKLPLLVSTGMSDMKEITETVKFLTDKQANFALLHCTSLYPTPLEKVGLNLISEFQKMFTCPIGLSDHSGSIYPGLMALTNNVSLLEVHVTFDRRLFGPDVQSSITIDELTKLIEAKEAFFIMRKNPVNKDVIAKELKAAKAIFGKSWAPVDALKANTVIKKDMLMLKKPGTGFLINQLDEIVGRRLRRDVTPQEILSEQDFEPKKEDY